MSEHIKEVSINRKDSAFFTHINLKTGIKFVIPPKDSKRVLICYVRMEVPSLKIKIDDIRHIMKQETYVKNKLLKRQMILQNVYLN